MARDVEKVWHETTDRPLRLVGGSANLLYGSVLYFADRPSLLEIASPQLTPWVDEARIARDGIALYCPAADSVCMKALNARAAGSVVGKRVEVEVSRSIPRHRRQARALRDRHHPAAVTTLRSHHLAPSFRGARSSREHGIQTASFVALSR